MTIAKSNLFVQPLRGQEKSNCHTRSGIKPLWHLLLIFALAMFLYACRGSAPQLRLTEIEPPQAKTATGSSSQPIFQSVALDFNRTTTETIQPFWISTVGSCNAILWAQRTDDLKDQLAHVRRRLGTREVRFHNILSLVPRPQNGQYNFSGVDTVYDAILATGVRPFVEVSFMPRWLASGDKTIFRYRGNVTPPSDMDAWENLITAFVSHLIDRYGDKEVRQWRFEIWNEPDLTDFWSGSRDDYLYLYKNAVEAIKQVDPTLKVGGPSAAMSARDQGGNLVEWFLSRTERESIPVDFVTWHLYGGWAASRDDLSQGYQMRSGDDLRGRFSETYRSCATRNLPLYVTEWNCTPHPHDIIHDETLSAAYALNVVGAARGKCDEFAYWVFSDIFAEQGVPTKELSGGFGLLSLNGLEKPVFKAFEMLGMTTGGKWIIPQKGDDFPVLAAWKPDRKELVLLLWNWPYGKGGITSKLPALARSLEITINNLPRGKWKEKVIRLTASRANLTSAWRQMGSPDTPSSKQRRHLKRAARLTPETARLPIRIQEGNDLKCRAHLEPGDCAVIILKHS